MIATFTALLFAHVLADFVFQTNWIAANKQRFAVLLLHGAIVFATLVLATGSLLILPLALLTLAHLAIDAVKQYGTRATGLWPFLIDQAAHVATLIGAAVLVPHLWDTGQWVGHDWLLPLMAAVAGLLLSTRAGAFAVGFLMAPIAPPTLPDGLTNGGLLIGILERGLVFLLVLVGQPAGIGFLIAAKSVLRFDAASKDQSAGEYVIIGTLASFGWALTISFATVTWLSVLPPLPLGAATP